MSLKVLKNVYRRVSLFFLFNYKLSDASEDSTMKILPIPFGILRYVGVWRPAVMTDLWKKRLYNLHTLLLLLILYTFVASQFIQVVKDIVQYKKIPETLYLLLPTAAACFKACIFLLKKPHITCLGNMLSDDHCIARDAKEKQIQKRFDDISRYIAGASMFLVYAYLLLMMSTPLFGCLPCKIWLPFGVQHSRNYWSAYCYQILGLCCFGSINAGVDNIITGFMWQACAQFAILEHRLQTLPQLVQNVSSQMSRKQAAQYEKAMLIRYIQHHDYIYSYSANITEVFSSIIFVQFCTSSLVISVCVYQLSIASLTNFDVITALLYLIVVVVEFMLYCWFGNEIHCKSIRFAENVYQTNWMNLNCKFWKMLLFLICRCSKPIVISSYNMVFLSLNTFVQIMKLSYSAYNVLRESSAD